MTSILDQFEQGVDSAFQPTSAPKQLVMSYYIIHSRYTLYLNRILIRICFYSVGRKF